MVGVADFETINDVNDCRVWCWAVCNYETKQIEDGKDIRSFFDL